MIVKQLPDAVKSDGTKVPQESGAGLGANLAGGSTYYFDCSVPDGSTSSVHIMWDASITAVVNFQDSNAPAFKGPSMGPTDDPDNGVDVSIFNAGTAGQWVTEDPGTAYIPAANGCTIANMTVTITGGTANGTIFNLGNTGTRRGRLKVVTTVGGVLRVMPHGKKAG